MDPAQAPQSAPQYRASVEASFAAWLRQTGLADDDWGVLLGREDEADEINVRVQGGERVTAVERLPALLWQRRNNSGEETYAVGIFAGPGDAARAVAQREFAVHFPSPGAAFVKIDHDAQGGFTFYPLVRDAQGSLQFPQPGQPEADARTGAPHQPSDKQPQPSSRRRFPSIYRAVVVLAIFTAPLLWLLKSPRPAPPPIALGLQVQRQGEFLKVNWDRQAAPIRIAPGGTLDIVDGSDRRSIPLSQADLRKGSQLYLPRTAQVQLHLSVQQRNGIPTEEWLLTATPDLALPPSVPAPAPKPAVALSGVTPAPVLLAPPDFMLPVAGVRRIKPPRSVAAWRPDVSTDSPAQRRSSGARMEVPAFPSP